MNSSTKHTIRLIVARHCQTLLNVDDRYQGTKFDYPLTQVGMEQAFNLGDALDDHFKTTPVDKIIISDTWRAQQTAYLVTNGNTEIEYDKRLNPFGLGNADGKTAREMFTLFRFPIFARGKENFPKYLKRIRSFLTDTLKNNMGKTILIVTHEDITGVMDSYLTNTFILKAPFSGLKNGAAKIYDIELTDEPSKIKLTNKHQFGKLNTKTTYIDASNIDEK